MLNKIYIFIISLALIASCTSESKNKTTLNNDGRVVLSLDTIQTISAMKGAEVSFYNLYRDYKEKDKEKSMLYAERFISKLDTIPYSLIVADMCYELSYYYDKEKFLFSKAMKWAEISYDIYNKLGENYSHRFEE